MNAGLLFVIIAVAPCTWPAAVSGISPSGNDSGPECEASPYSNSSQIRENPTDEELQELILEGRCYLACITENYLVDKLKKKERLGYF